MDSSQESVFTKACNEIDQGLLPKCVQLKWDPKFGRNCCQSLNYLSLKPDFLGVQHVSGSNMKFERKRNEIDWKSETKVLQFTIRKVQNIWVLEITTSPVQVTGNLPAVPIACKTLSLSHQDTFFTVSASQASVSGWQDTPSSSLPAAPSDPPSWS